MGRLKNNKVKNQVFLFLINIDSINLNFKPRKYLNFRIRIENNE